MKHGDFTELAKFYGNRPGMERVPSGKIISMEEMRETLLYSGYFKNILSL